jgi:hypothetical protein
VVVVVGELFEEELPDEPFVLVVVAEPLDVEELVDPGRIAARATAPATPETPTTEVTAFMRARSRRRLRCGWSNIGLALRPLGSAACFFNYLRPR